MSEHSTNIPGGLETDTSSVDWVIDQYLEEYGHTLTNGRKHEYEAIDDQGVKLDYVIFRLAMSDERGERNEEGLNDAITLRSLHAVRWIEQKMKLIDKGQSLAYDMYPSIDYWAVVDQATEEYLDQLMQADYRDKAIRAKEDEKSFDDISQSEWRTLYQLGDCAISKCVTPVLTRYVVQRQLGQESSAKAE